MRKMVMRKMVMRVMRVMRLMRVVMEKLSNLAHQEVVSRPSLVLVVRSPWPRVLFYFIFQSFIY